MNTPDGGVTDEPMPPEWVLAYADAYPDRLVEYVEQQHAVIDDFDEKGVMTLINKIIRGCGNLPHVGPHPGTETLFLFCALGGVDGAKFGWVGALFGFTATLACFGPIYLWGAYDRAELSDTCEAEKRGERHDPHITTRKEHSNEL